MRSLIEACGLGQDSFPLVWVNWSFWYLHRQFPPVTHSSELWELVFSNIPWWLFQIEGSGHWKVSQLICTCTCAYTWMHTHRYICAHMNTLPFESWDHKFLLLLLTLYSSEVVFTAVLSPSQRPSMSHMSLQLLPRVIGWAHSQDQLVIYMKWVLKDTAHKDQLKIPCFHKCGIVWRSFIVPKISESIRKDSFPKKLWV